MDGAGIVANGKTTTGRYSKGRRVQLRYNRPRDRGTKRTILLG